MPRIATLSSLALALAAALPGLAPAARADMTLLNVSYDPTRELYADYNQAFAKHWEATQGEKVTINQSHGGSGKQARAVIDGLEADVVTLALSGDIDAIYQRAQLIPKAWQKRLPNNSCPYTSTIVFLVKKGNPKGIHDWDDVVKPGVAVITPNPKTSGGARWNYLAAWAYALKQSGGDEAAAKAFVEKLYQQRADPRHRRARLDHHLRRARHRRRAARLGERGLPRGRAARPGQVRDRGAVAQHPRGAAGRGGGRGGAPQRHAARSPRPTSSTSTAPEAQEIIAKHHYRPSLEAVQAKYASKFPTLELVTIEKDFGGWKEAQAKHFAEGGIFDQIYAPGR